MATQNSSSLISSICKSRKVILDLMERLDYNINDYKNFTTDEINTKFKNSQLDMLIEKNNVNESTKRKTKMYIRYYLAKTINETDIRNLITDLYELTETLTNEDTLYIIIKYEPNSTIITLLKHIWETEGIFIVIQNIKRLQFNILEHIYVPPHRILDENEKNQIMVKYNIQNDAQFPDISRFDPVSQAICLRPGQVCEIMRPSKTAVFAPYYRICV